MSHLDEEFRMQNRQRYSAQLEEIQVHLEGLLGREGVVGLMLVDADGHPIAASGDLSTHDPDLLVALSSACYAALAQVFSALGNGPVNHILVSGIERGFSVQPMGRGALLLLSWDVTFPAPELEDWYGKLGPITALLEHDRN